MAKRAIIIHGFKGHPKHGWKPWLAAELRKHGFIVKNPRMPNTNHPKIKSWVERLAALVGKPDTDCYLIGHSLGCITILRYLETLKDNEKIGGAVLIAGPVKRPKNKYKELASFFSSPIQWKKIKRHCRRFVAIHSDDDNTVPLQHSRIVQQKLGAQLIVKHGMKHFSGSDGIIELPDALKAVLKLSKMN